MRGKKTHPLAARIKRIMQQDEDVGKIAHAAPVLIAKALELFMSKLCVDTAAIAKERGAKTISASHVKSTVQSDELLDFLKDVVAAVPDLAEETKRQPRVSETAGEGEGGGEGGGRGRGRGGRRGRGRPPLGEGRGQGRGRGRKRAAAEAVEEGASELRAVGTVKSEERGFSEEDANKKMKAEPEDVKVDEEASLKEEEAAGPSEPVAGGTRISSQLHAIFKAPAGVVDAEEDDYDDDYDEEDED